MGSTEWDSSTNPFAGAVGQGFRTEGGSPAVTLVGPVSAPHRRGAHRSGRPTEQEIAMSAQHVASALRDPVSDHRPRHQDAGTPPDRQPIRARRRRDEPVFLDLTGRRNRHLRALFATATAASGVLLVLLALLVLTSP
jgi:hypothetical protein